MVTCITLPFPPSTNAIWRNNRRTHKSPRYKAWLRVAKNAIHAQQPKQVKGPISVDFRIERPDRRRRDLDNFLKAALDVLTQCAVIEDDYLVEDLRAAWAGPGKEIHITIRPSMSNHTTTPESEAA